MRYINVDAFIDDKLSRICSKCDRRKSRDGKRFIYAVGEAPCRACELGDMIDEIDDFPTVDLEEVIHCRDCIHKGEHRCRYTNMYVGNNDYCSFAERKKE